MSTFYQFTQEEFEQFLGVGSDAKPVRKGGFHLLPLQGTRELVYGKRIHPEMSLRIYSTIEHGVARERGSDAIRIRIVWLPPPDKQEIWKRNGLARPDPRYPDRPIFPKFVGGSKRVHRVRGWSANLSERLAHYDEIMPPTCVCGCPMVWRTPSKRKPFWGCVWMWNCPKRPLS